MADTRLYLPPSIRNYHQFREHLCMINVVTCKDGIVISPALREDNPCRPPGHTLHDLQGQNIYLLAWHHMIYHPLGATAATAIEWRPHRPIYLQHLYRCHAPSSNAYVLTTSTTKDQIISRLSTDTPNGQS